MNGLSERLLVSHYEHNYGGALRQLNANPDERTYTDHTPRQSAGITIVIEASPGAAPQVIGTPVIDAVPVEVDHE